MSEGPERHFSYESMKQIVKFSEMDKRERMVRSIPALKKIESLLRYDFSKVRYSSQSFDFETNNFTRSWNIYPLRPEQEDWSEDNEIDPKTLTSCVINFHTDGYRFEHSIEKKYSVALTKLMKEYVRKGSRIEKLVIHDSVPEELQDENLKLKVSRLILGTPNKEMIATWLRLMDTDNHPLKTIKFIVCTNSMFMFKEPVVQSCKELILQFPFYEEFALDPLLLDFTNKQLDIIKVNFPMDMMEKLIRKWLNYRRPVGTSFSLGVQEYTEVISFFDMAKDKFKAVPSKFPDIKDGTCHCVVIPIDEQMELVLFGEYRQKKCPPFIWNFRMEVMKPGRTVPKKV